MEANFISSIEEETPVEIPSSDGVTLEIARQPKKKEPLSRKQINTDSGVR